MFAEEELIPTKAESGLWYYQWIDEVGNLYPDKATIADILGTGDLTPSGDDGAELREADTATPDHLEHRFADVISAIEALREEVRKSERDRKESDKIRDEQLKELVRMIQTL
ncbi:hypothetical protein LWI29_031508 [Acer saccharum]|uniref:Uncharacterized protein n=1 Tax=Acer saccharum TaxID=4024 RepID=A0AA39SNH6_ACESA|nr:hypothetical protein LWI29_031508 [Acer saccharum]